MIDKILPFVLCYVLLIILLLFMARKIVGFVRPMEEKNNFSITVFALLCVIMAVVFVTAFLLSVESSFSELLENHYVFMLVIIFLVQFALSLFLLFSCRKEVSHLFRYGMRQIFPITMLVIMLSYVLSTIVLSTIF